MIARAVGQWLNPIDRTMRCVDVALRQLGYPGIETQMLVWLAGRADTAVLQQAIARLSQAQPAIAGRLVEPSDDEGMRSYWEFRPGAVCPLRERHLASDDSEAVLAAAGEILSSGQDPAVADPLEFHLLHRPGGRDVLLLQYNHALMDNTASVPLLRELERLCRGEELREAEMPACDATPRRLVEHLRQSPKPQRRQAIRAAIELQAHALRGRAATLLPRGPEPAGRARLHIQARTLDRAETAALRAWTIRACGFPCLSMAVLGSAFRAVAQLGPATDESRDFIAGIGIPLSRPNPPMPLLQNWTSAVPLRVSRSALGDRQPLVRLLAEQLRQRLQTGVDQGVLETLALFSRRFRYIEWVIWHLVRYGYSLWYGYFGDLDIAAGQLAGAAIEDVFYTGGPVWSSIGLTLLVSQYQGQLHLQATYDPRLVSSARAEEFLDWLRGELTQTNA